MWVCKTLPVSNTTSLRGGALSLYDSHKWMVFKVMDGISMWRRSPHACSSSFVPVLPIYT